MSHLPSVPSSGVNCLCVEECTQRWWYRWRSLLNSSVPTVEGYDSLLNCFIFREQKHRWNYTNKNKMSKYILFCKIYICIERSWRQWNYSIMMDICLYTFVQIQRTYNSKSEPQYKVWTLDDNDVLIKVHQK